MRTPITPISVDERHVDCTCRWQNGMSVIIFWHPSCPVHGDSGRAHDWRQQLYREVQEGIATANDANRFLLLEHFVDSLEGEYRLPNYSPIARMK